MKKSFCWINLAGGNYRFTVNPQGFRLQMKGGKCYTFIFVLVVVVVVYHVTTVASKHWQLKKLGPVVISYVLRTTCIFFKAKMYLVLNEYKVQRICQSEGFLVSFKKIYQTCLQTSRVASRTGLFLMNESGSGFFFMLGSGSTPPGS